MSQRSSDVPMLVNFSIYISLRSSLNWMVSFKILILPWLQCISYVRNFWKIAIVRIFWCFFRVMISIILELECIPIYDSIYDSISSVLWASFCALGLGDFFTIWKRAGYILICPDYGCKSCMKLTSKILMPSFADGGAPTLKGVPTYYFGHFFPKTPWYWKKMEERYACIPSTSFEVFWCLSHCA